MNRIRLARINLGRIRLGRPGHDWRCQSFLQRNGRPRPIS